MDAVLLAVLTAPARSLLVAPIKEARGHGKAALMKTAEQVSCGNWTEGTIDPVLKDAFWLAREQLLQNASEGVAIVGVLEEMRARFKESVSNANCREREHKEWTENKTAIVNKQLASHADVKLQTTLDEIKELRAHEHKLYHTHLEMDHAAMQTLSQGLSAARHGLTLPKGAERERILEAAKAFGLKLCAEALDGHRKHTSQQQASVGKKTTLAKLVKLLNMRLTNIKKQEKELEKADEKAIEQEKERHHKFLTVKSKFAGEEKALEQAVKGIEAGQTNAIKDAMKQLADLGN